MLVEERGGTVWWNSGTVMEKQCGGTVLVEHSVKQRWWNSVVEQWNSDGGTVIVEQSGRKVEQCWLNNETEMVEQCGGKVEQCGGKVEQCGGTVLMAH